uniref:Uncharacterized protein n=1 Tax=Alexandrium monilatum TaxID=311494 RepID=A0A7S4PSB9_9DINO
MPAPVAGEFYVSHDAERPPEKQQRRLWQDVHLLEGYLDRPDAHEDKWQYARSVFYLAQSHRSLGFADTARELWERFLGLGFSQKRQFTYLGYGAHNALGQICAEESVRRRDERLPQDCRKHFEEAHKICPRVEPLVYMAMAMPTSSRERLEVLRRATRVAPMQAASGHCAIFAEPGAYERLPQLLREAEREVAEQA